MLRWGALLPAPILSPSLRSERGTGAFPECGFDGEGPRTQAVGPGGDRRCQKGGGRHPRPISPPHTVPGPAAPILQMPVGTDSPRGSAAGTTAPWDVSGFSFPALGPWDPFLLCTPRSLQGHLVQGSHSPPGEGGSGTGSDLPRGEGSRPQPGPPAPARVLPWCWSSGRPGQGGRSGLRGHCDLCQCCGGCGESGRYVSSLAFICLLMIPISGAFFFFSFVCAFILSSFLGLSLRVIQREAFRQRTTTCTFK